MKKKSIFKRTLKMIALLSFLCLSIILIKYSVENEKSIEKIDIPTMQTSTMTISNNTEESIDVGELDIVVLYNTVLVPINDTFKALFGSDYTEDVNQTIKYGSMTLNIDFENNTITIPNFYTYGTQKMDNTVVVEIEEYNNKRYIPLYLISNLNNMTVKLDGIEIYKNNNYVSSIEVVKNKNENHIIQIISEIQKNDANDTYFGQALGSLWREEALKRIEKYRKNDSNIIVKNKNNRILDNTKIEISIVNNDFKFGTAIAYFNKKNYYNGITKNKFNMIGAENSFKWNFMEQYGFERCIDIESNASETMSVRGHCLWWDYIFSEDVSKLIGNTENPQEGTMAYIYKNFHDGKINYEEAEKLSAKLQEEFENKILNHIEQLIRMFPNISEWDVINEVLTRQYFKQYLYDRKFLTDDTFLTADIIGKSTNYTENEEYYKFLGKCFDKAREIKNENKLVLNDNIITGNIQGNSANNVALYVSGIKKYTQNIDAIGVQYHLYNRYHYSPQSYYNSINKVLKETEIKEAVITEYDNFVEDKIEKYSKEEKNTKADYLRDAVIMAYSNPNISEFTFWVYNGSHFEDEERKAYEELVTPWLNYSEKGIGDENGYNTRLYKGEYTATIKLANGKEKVVNFKVSDDTDNTIEVVFECKLEKLEIKQLPVKINYYENDNLLLTDGMLTAYYDDGTVEEIDMTSDKVKVTGYNKNKLGKQIINVEYDGKSVNFEIDITSNIRDNVTEDVATIKNSNNQIMNKYKVLYEVDLVNKNYQTINKSLDLLVTDLENNSIYRINAAYQAQIDLLNTIVELYNSGYIEISDEQFKDLLQSLINITDDYKELYSYYAKNDNYSNSAAQNSINALIKKYNKNFDSDIEFLEDIILNEKDIYENKLQSSNVGHNYLNKQRIVKVSEILTKIINTKVEKIVSEEKSKLQLYANRDITLSTNQDITITLKHGEDTKIINNKGKDSYTFTENGTFRFELSIRNEIFEIPIEISCIDKKAPVVEGVEDGKIYYQNVIPSSKDTDIKEVNLYYNDNLVKYYTFGSNVNTIGKYKLEVIDKASNKTSITFEIGKTISQSDIKQYTMKANYITGIIPGTTKDEFVNNSGLANYTKVYRSNKEISKTDVIKTGDTINLNGTAYVLVVKGDLTGTGSVGIMDIMQTKRSITSGTDLEEVKKEAADINGDSQINITDVMMLIRMTANN